ncbi:MAG: PilN domain-containing protein, partial [Balneolaceae bacterium]
SAGSKVVLTRFDRLDLVRPIEEDLENPEKFSFASENLDETESIFGIQQEKQDQGTEEQQVNVAEQENEEINFDDIDLFETEDEESLDLVDESGREDTNELLLYNYLLTTGQNKNYIAANILSGNTIFQFVGDSDFSKVKRKNLQELIENKLESVYGGMPPADYYNSYVREDGSLVIASIDREPPVISLLNHVDAMASGKVYIQNLLPDEVALTGLYRMNYDEGDQRITGLIQFGVHRCRILFFKGHELLQISPIINEGTRFKKFLNTVFSKILFQLDSGEISGLDRIVLADNTLGEKAIHFFEKNFPGMEVDNFTLDPDKFDVRDQQVPAVSKFTTAIAIATGSTETGNRYFPNLSLVPAYVIDRQKIFKLQWHGILLLVAIGLSPVVLNHFYQSNQSTLDNLELESARYQNLVNEIEPTVRQTEYLSEMLELYQEQLILLEELVDGNIRWTTSLNRFNQAVQNIGNIWVTSLRQSENGLNIDGYSLYEDRIPALARQFSNVTLRHVRREQIREMDLYYFTMQIHDVVGDPSLFTPESTRQIRDLLTNNSEE